MEASLKRSEMTRKNVEVSHLKNYLHSLCIRIAHLDLSIEKYNQLFGTDIIFILRILMGTFRTIVNVTTVSVLGSVFSLLYMFKKYQKSYNNCLNHHERRRFKADVGENAIFISYFL